MTLVISKWVFQFSLIYIDSSNNSNYYGMYFNSSLSLFPQNSTFIKDSILLCLVPPIKNLLYNKLTNDKTAILTLLDQTMTSMQIFMKRRNRCRRYFDQQGHLYVQASLTQRCIAKDFTWSTCCACGAWQLIGLENLLLWKKI